MVKSARVLILNELLGRAVKVLGYVGIAEGNQCSNCSAFEDTIKPIGHQADEMISRIELLLRTEGGVLCD